MTTLEMENVLKMPRREKLQMMETLWEDLSRPEAEQKSPDWHLEVLRETEQRMASGRETAMDWADAKQRLRTRSE